MKALAEFVMRGRLQAGLVAAAGNLVPFVSPAAVGLVTLRRGRFEGTLILLFAALPVLLASGSSGLTVVLSLVTVLSLLVVVASAETLKGTVSWTLALIVMMIGSGICALLTDQLLSSQLQEVEETLRNFLTAEGGDAATSEQFSMFVSRQFLLGLIAYLTMLNVLVSMLLARWWQSQLYNPGGFREEMHHLRLGVYPAATFGVLLLICYAAGYSSWGALVGLPLLVNGICLVHFTVAAQNAGGYWLAMMYVGLIIFSPLSLVIVGLGFADSLMNLRTRIPRRPENGA